jgi:2-amino-4-hydroxy-6-hydroxymethyldihydropteridine diphosphokinase
MANVILSIGSNIEPRAQHLKDAVRELKKHLEVKAVSSLYESEAVGFEGDAFLNAAVWVVTDVSAMEVLNILQQIENKGGRVRSSDSGYTSRTIDLDLIFYDAQIIVTSELMVPHPRFALRKFVLVPVCELIPEWIDPISQLSISDLLVQCKDSNACILFSD